MNLGNIFFGLHIQRVNTSVAPEPRLGSARIWLELLVKKLGSARLAQYFKKLLLENFS